MVPLLPGVELIRGGLSDGLSFSLPRGWREESAKASSENEAGSLSSLESMKECVRPGEMSDKLLGWSLEIVISSRPTPQRKNRTIVSSRK